MNRILLATDLDRTIIPNGAQKESPGARGMFKKLVSRKEVEVLYVSGRWDALFKEAIREFSLPVPRYAIGYVGAVIYKIHNGENFEVFSDWEKSIAPDWRGRSWEDIKKLFEGINQLELQERERQNKFKLSYYAPEDTDHKSLLYKMQGVLESQGIKASLIWSIDEQQNKGLLDVLPECATKMHALRFMMDYLGFTEENTVFCGDSGNDLPVLTSGIKSVLVKNARDEVKQQATQSLKEKGLEDRLYIAKGCFLGMNGNYSAGVLEGVVHFFPEVLIQ